MDNNLMEIKDIKQKYEELKKRYEELIIEFSENTIISSMNDMKNEKKVHCAKMRCSVSDGLREQFRNIISE